MSLKYSKDAVIKGFTGMPTPQQRVNEINAMANNCRMFNQPIFADETQFLPVDSALVNTEVSVVVGKKPEPPKKAQDDTLMNAVVLGLGVFVLYKLLS